MRCWACGKDNLEGEVFCIDCGFPQNRGKQSDVVTDIRCPVCNQINGADNAFCYHCGNYLSPIVEPQTCLKAKIVLPNGREIIDAGVSMLIDRSLFNDILSENELRLISRNHARITMDNDQYFIEDFGLRGNGSTNGTKLNGVSINDNGRHLLSDGDLIRLADIEGATLIFRKNQE